MAPIPRNVLVNEIRSRYADLRADAFSRGDRGLIDSIHGAISAGQPVSDISAVRRYFRTGNFFFLDHVLGPIEASGPRNVTQRAEASDCLDGRRANLAFTNLTSDRELTIYRSAGNLIEVGPGGCVIGHERCGAAGVVHEHAMGRLVIPASDADLVHLTTTWGPEVSRIPDQTERAIAFARAQSLRLGSAAVFAPVTSDSLSVVTGSLDNWVAHETARDLAASIGVSTSLGFDLTKHFVLAVAVCDPRRLHYPLHGVLGLGPNMLAVAAGRIVNPDGSVTMSPEVMTGVRYATSHGAGEHGSGGHIGGVKDTKLIIVVDPDPHVAVKIRDAMLAASEELRDATHGGETIKTATLQRSGLFRF